MIQLIHDHEVGKEKLQEGVKPVLIWGHQLQPPQVRCCLRKYCGKPVNNLRYNLKQLRNLFPSIHFCGQLDTLILSDSLLRKRMFQKFIGDKLQQQLEIQSTRAAEDALRMSWLSGKTLWLPAIIVCWDKLLRCIRKNEGNGCRPISLYRSWPILR